MKRKDMIDVLQKAFLEHMNCHNCCMNDEQMYSRILQSLEDAGMAPPLIECKSYKMLDSGEITYAVRMWEVEIGLDVAKANCAESQCNCDHCQSSIDRIRKD